MANTITAGIIGASGYAGAQLVRLIAAHPHVELSFAGSRRYEGQALSSVYGSLRDRVNCVYFNDDTEIMKEELAKKASAVDVLFMATPQGACASMMTEELLQNTKVIDLSADFRLKDVQIYEKWYGISHAAPQFLPEAVYGLTELNRASIKNARIVANPGCYTTCSILTCYPLVKEGLIDPDTLIIDALSGVSGAGRSAKVANLFTEVNENVKAYGVASHRHTPEIEEQLSYTSKESLTITFTPHLVPMQRGILVTAYAQLAESNLDYAAKYIKEAYVDAYEHEPFIRLLGEGGCPETRHVSGSNYVDIGFVIDKRTRRIIALGALDNLMKGAATQAIQNMNVMFDLEEDLGIHMLPTLP